ncbi:MAG: signal recognition particle protein [Rickettsiales bacterium]|jgi:signal recognition particle subunit SRP54|nr:signal recognition particle protein [Rickettsiales bacterium]
MFGHITKSFSNIIGKISGKRTITEADLNGTLRDLRLTLLEADVSAAVVRDFINSLRENLAGQEILKKVSPSDMIIKLIHDELLKIFGEEAGDLDISNSPTIIMVVGLQGGGKTTTCVKLANRFKNKFNRKVLLVSLDVYREAAREQLEILAKSLGIDALEIIEGQTPLEICKRAMLEKNRRDVIIFDTAGRLFIDENMMGELREIKNFISPRWTILTADSLTGQEAVNIAVEFNRQITVDGIILTKLDGDGRGGAALSMRAAVGKPINYVGIGEKAEDFDLFHPKRIVSKILDKGDIVSLVEKAEELINREEAEEWEKKIRKGKFDLNDFLKQINMLKKFGGLGKILSFIPGFSKLNNFLGDGALEENKIEMQRAIILSMTPGERSSPDILNSSRKFRIARGSGVSIRDVNSLMKKFKTMEQMIGSIGAMTPERLKDVMRGLGDVNNEAFGGQS